VYLVSSSGGPAKLVAAGDFSGPTDLRFSPDDGQLASSWGGQLVLIGVNSGASSRPIYTDNFVRQPDWSPDGKSIVYARFFLDPGEPVDSAGLHLFDPETGTDHALCPGVAGTHPRWSRDGSSIVFTENTTYSLRVSLVRQDGTGLLPLAIPSDGILYDYPQWYYRRATGSSQVLFEVSSGPTRPTYVIDSDGTGLRRWTRRLGPFDAISPDGSHVAIVFAEPSDSLGVLFITQTDDACGAAYRQLTAWRPPVAGSLSIGGPGAPIGRHE
jgi:dipeptidyl aminopeptidase/acylaminoacyl peptidase